MTTIPLEKIINRWEDMMDVSLLLINHMRSHILSMRASADSTYQDIRVNLLYEIIWARTEIEEAVFYHSNTYKVYTQ